MVLQNTRCQSIVLYKIKLKNPLDILRSLGHNTAMNDASVEFGERLKSQIQTSGLSVRNVHEALIRDGYSITIATIYNWMDGKGQPGADMIRALCVALGCCYADLLGPKPETVDSPRP
jgi:hypothetical protein